MSPRQTLLIGNEKNAQRIQLKRHEIQIKPIRQQTQKKRNY
jgi:hypothetical protein